MAAIQDSIRYLETLSKREDSILVAYSGGKDSLVVLDLCCRTFKTVRAFFKFMVPGLEVCEKYMRFAKERYGVEVVQFPSNTSLLSKATGAYCDQVDGLEQRDIPLKLSFAHALRITGCRIMATGMKDADGLKRRQFFANCRDGEDPFWKAVHHPIREWCKKDVIDYLKVHDIPIPDCESGAVTSGVGLDHGSLCWLHDSHPEDFKRLLRWFPYAEAAIKRRDWFGVGLEEKGESNG